jgi:hypothetical protein
MSSQGCWGWLAGSLLRIGQKRASWRRRTYGSARCPNRHGWVVQSLNQRKFGLRSQNHVTGTAFDALIWSCPLTLTTTFSPSCLLPIPNFPDKRRACFITSFDHAMLLLKLPGNQNPYKKNNEGTSWRRYKIPWALLWSWKAAPWILHPAHHPVFVNRQRSIRVYISRYVRSSFNICFWLNSEI